MTGNSSLLLAITILILSPGAVNGCSSSKGIAPDTDTADPASDQTSTPAEDSAGEVLRDAFDNADRSALDTFADGGLEDDTEVTGNACSNGLMPSWVATTGEGYAYLTECGEHKLTIHVVEDGIVRLRYLPQQPGFDHSYAMVDQDWPEPSVQFGSTGSSFAICTGRIVLSLEEETCRVTVTDLQGNLIMDEPGTGGYYSGFETVDGEEVMTRNVERSSPAGELFYGFGEKTGPLDKRGTTMEFWNSDTPGYGTDVDPLYQSIPFFVGLRGEVAYGLFVDNTHRLKFDMADSNPTSYVLTAYGGEMDLYLIAGPKFSKVLERYTRLTGRMSLPPRWTLGYHQARWSYYPDSQVVDVCEEFRKREIPADGIWLDIDYMDGYRSWTWDPAGFSNPAGFVEQVGDIGFKVTAIIDPGLKVDPEWDIYQQGVAGGHFLLGDQGTPFVGVVWPGPAVYPDFTRPDTREWWAGLVPRLTDFGVRGIWLDMNEPASFLPDDNHTVPGYVKAFGDGHETTMDEIHNVYALVEAMATRQGMLEAAPSRRPFMLTRAGSAGIQRYAAVWTGDAPSDMDAAAQALPMLMGLGLSGVPFVGSDVGGWTGGATPELFARWVEVGAVSPFFRGHVQWGAIDQEPWAFGKEVEEISRLAIGERYRLLPYLYSLFREASLTGAPILRPLVYEFQEDPAVRTLSYQAMLGPWMLYAPVVEEGALKRSIYFPAGRWLEFHSSALVEGPAKQEIGVTLQALPVYLREGSIVPRSQLMSYSDEEPIDPLYLELFPAGEATTFTLYEDDGDSLDYQEGHYSEITYTAQLLDSGAILEASPRKGAFVPPPRHLFVRARRADHPPSTVSLFGTDLAELPTLEELETAQSGWFYDENDLSILVAFPDQPDFTLVMEYDPGITEPSPVVLVPVKVKLPPDTQKDSPIHIATSAAGWSQQPLEWGDEPDTAVGDVPVQRGEWFFYKYTRGDWESVEKWSGCLETTDRYAFGKAHPVKEDSVEMWADQCD